MRASEGEWGRVRAEVWEELGGSRVWGVWWLFILT